MAKLVVYANTSDKAVRMAPDDVEIRFVDDKGEETFDLAQAEIADIENRTNKLRPPVIKINSFNTTIKTLADGSVVADVEFDIEEVFGATDYSVRYS